MIRAIALCMAAIATATPAAGQACLGLTPLDASRGHAGGRLGTGDEATEIGAAATWGGALSVNARLAINDLEGFDSQTIGALGATYEFRPEASEVRWCPLATATYVWWPDVLGFDVSEQRAHVGVAFGARMPAGSIEILPFAIGLLGMRWVQASFESPQVVVEGEARDLHGIIEAGAAILFGGRIAIRGAVEVPVALEAFDRRLLLGVSFGVGRRGP